MNPLIRKLETFTKLSGDDKLALQGLMSDVRQVQARAAILEEAATPTHAHLIVEGFACRCKILSSGERQITSFLIPGDLCDGHLLVLEAMDHTIETITPCRIAYIPHRMLHHLTEHHPAITRALWWTSLVEEGVAREWITNVGRRPANKRVAHLLCEMIVRLRMVGLASDHGCDLPLTQNDLADATGLTSVHVNRVLQELRAAGLITLRRKKLTVERFEALTDFADFHPNYLHLGRRESSLAGASLASQALSS